jgi:hypothetical protein
MVLNHAGHAAMVAVEKALSGRNTCHITSIVSTRGKVNGYLVQYYVVEYHEDRVLWCNSQGESKWDMII